MKISIEFVGYLIHELILNENAYSHSRHFTRKRTDTLKISTDNQHILTIIQDLTSTVSFIIDDSSTTTEKEFFSLTTTSLVS